MIEYLIQAFGRSGQFDHGHHVTLLNIIRTLYRDRAVESSNRVEFSHDAPSKGHRFGPLLRPVDDNVIVFTSEDQTRQWIERLYERPKPGSLADRLFRLRTSDDYDRSDYLRELASRAECVSSPYRCFTLTDALIMDADLVTSDFSTRALPGPASVTVRYADPE